MDERDTHFDRLRRTLAEYYLAEPGSPYRQSGRSSGAERWEESRRCIALAVDRDGDFMDVGCANGLLLESLIAWCAESGHDIRPHGIDFIPELVELARQRLPTAPAYSFEVVNAWYWEPSRRYDFVRANLEYVLSEDRVPFFCRLLERAVEPGGRLIACYYFPSRDEGVEDPPDPGRVLEDIGLAIAGKVQVPGVRLAWADRSG